LSSLKSFGAAQFVAQWARWKTVLICQHVFNEYCEDDHSAHTFFDAVLIGLAVVLLLLLGHTLDTFVVVVLVWCAVLGLSTFYCVYRQ
jgi:cell division protein FtsW (lipid II flippase)